MSLSRKNGPCAAHGKASRKAHPAPATRHASRAPECAPSAGTKIKSACRTVESRCAITNDVRPASNRCSARWISCSVDGIHARRRLVEDQHRRDSSAAPARSRCAASRRPKASPPLTDMRVVALWQRRDEVMHATPPAPSPSISARVASGRPKRRLSRIVPLKRNVSCDTTPICSRNSRSEISATLRPSSTIFPPVAS